MFQLDQLITPEYFPNPLLNREHQKSSTISVYSPAVTSSGDVYHIAAYCMLCEHFNWHMPKIFLSYDCDKTKIHAQRAQNFLKTLFGDRVSCDLLDTPTKAPRPNTRNILALEKTRQHQSVDQVNELIINQKMLTSLINSAIIEYNFNKITSILRHGFKNKQILKRDGKPISSWIAKNVLATKKTITNTPFVILHNRYSNDTNDNQNLSTNTLTTIINILRTNGIKVVLVKISSSKKYQAIKNVENIDAFEKIKNLDPIYSKFQHILLLSALSRLPGCRGVIGGTSGTLDVLAFMGINILNIHNFSDRANITFAPQQDFRLLLQSVFMSVCDNDLTENTILFWLLFRDFSFKQHDTVSMVCRNFLFNHGTIPLALNNNNDNKKEREIFNVAYSPNSTSKPVNFYYPFQKDILGYKEKLCDKLKNYINNRQKTIIAEQTEFQAIKNEFNTNRISL